MPHRGENSTKLIRTSVAASAAALALLTGPALADVKAGVDAWSAGDFNRAVTEWQGPAQSGDADALFNLAQAYRLGRGVTADIARARELYAEAAQKGHVKAADNYGLLLFQQGEQGAAMPFIKDAADRGDPRAQYVLGLAHFNADYAQKDWVRAYALLTLSQSAGLPQAGEALVQMDKYVPIEQRQQAQSLARAMEAEASKRRAAELAAADLGSRPVATAPASATPAQAASVASPAQPPQVYQPTAPQRVAAAPAGKWRVQLGAFGVRGNAEKLWGKLSGNPALSGTDKVLVPAGKVVRLQAVGFQSRADAQSACNTLKAQGQACMVAKP